MCVAIVVPDQIALPDIETLSACERYNTDGGGCAWLEGSRVHWKKGLKLGAKEIHELLSTKPGPKMIHFRIKTSGGKLDELCHPFQITSVSKTDLEGSNRSGVLFHNGVWNKWDDVLLARYMRKLDGEWSDTRFIATLVADLGEKALELIGSGQRFAALYPDRWTTWGSWDKIGEVYFSNVYWKSYLPTKSYSSSPSSSVNGNVKGHTVCAVGACCSQVIKDSIYCDYHTSDRMHMCAWDDCHTRIAKRYDWCKAHAAQGKAFEKELDKQAKAIREQRRKEEATPVPFEQVSPQTGNVIDKDGKIIGNRPVEDIPTYCICAPYEQPCVEHSRPAKDKRPNMYRLRPGFNHRPSGSVLLDTDLTPAYQDSVGHRTRKILALSIDDNTGAIVEQDEALNEIVESCSHPRDTDAQTIEDYNKAWEDQGGEG